MKIYLCGRYGRRVELAGCAEELRADGHEVTSRWLDGSQELDRADAAGEVDVLSLTTSAMSCWSDVRRAEVLVAFTEELAAGFCRGGRHVELGIAIERGLGIIVVGPRENCFCYHPRVEQFDAWPLARAFLHRWTESPHERLQRVETRKP